MLKPLRVNVFQRTILQPTANDSNHIVAKKKVDFYEETLGFSFTNKDFTEEISELQINSRSRELYYDKIQDLEPDVSRKLL